MRKSVEGVPSAPSKVEGKGRTFRRKLQIFVESCSQSRQEEGEIKTGGGLGIWGLGAEDVTEERRGRDRMANRSGSSGEAG